MKRTAVGLVAVIWMCSVFGCQFQRQKGITEKNTQKEISLPLEKEITVTAMIRDFNRSRTKKIDRLLEERTNIKIDWTIVPASEYEVVFDTKFHSGELPDVFETTKELTDRFCKEGGFVDFSQYLEKMPNLCSWIEKIPSIYYDTADAEGCMYCLTTFNTRGQAPKQTLYRRDLFEKEGLKAPESVDELYEALVKLKAKYPDSIPVGNRWGIEMLLESVASLYHTKMGFYLDNDTLEYRFGPFTEEFRDAVAMLQKFYRADLLDPEFATISDSQFVKDITDGKILFLFSEYTCCLHTKIQGDWSGEGAKHNPDFEMAPLTPLQTKYGRGFLNIQSPTSKGHFAVGINSQSNYVDEIIALLDDQYSAEVINLVNWGVEGETYEIRDGEKQWLISEEERTEWGLDARSGIWVPIDQDCSDTTLDERDLAIVRESNKNIDQFAFYDPKRTLVFEKEEKERIEAINEALSSSCMEDMFRFITGEYDMEKDWDAYIRKLEKMGAREMLELYQTAYEALPEEQKGLDKELGL